MNTRIQFASKNYTVFLEHRWLSWIPSTLAKLKGKFHSIFKTVLC